MNLFVQIEISRPLRITKNNNYKNIEFIELLDYFLQNHTTPRKEYANWPMHDNG